MAAAVGIGRFVLYVTVVPCLVAGSVVRTRTCPLANCQNHNGQSDNVEAGTESLLELSSKSSARAKAKGCGMTFMPAHYTCSSCDVSTCQGCNNLVCDLSKCIGKFYSQECWCTKPGNPKVDKFFCDSDCTGGLCNTYGLKCKTRESSCKPWWWCQLPPPKEAPSFLQKMAERRQGGCAKHESASSLNARVDQAKAEVVASSAVQQQSGAIKRQISAFKFEEGSWICESALLPSPDEDPVTLMEKPAGFIVLNADSCKGGFFSHKCYCYDKFKYFSGEDPEVNEFMCDEKCGNGPCGGKTCGDAPPPPAPAPKPPPPIDPLVQMEEFDAEHPQYDTPQMSPIQ